MIKRAKVLVIFLLFLNILFGQIYKTDKATYEFVGLKEWKFDCLIDSIKSLGKPNSFHPCGAELTEKLNFVEATVMGRFSEDGKLYTVIKLIEDSSKIKYSPLPEFKLPVNKNYKELEIIFNNNPHILNAALYSYQYKIKGEIEKSEEIIKNWRVDSTAVSKLWNFIERYDSQEDYEKAIWILKSDRNIINQKCAMLTLINFNEFDLSWWLVIEKLRYPNQQIAGTAREVLNLLSESFCRKINWEPVATSLKYLLNGTFLWGYDDVIKVLTKTEIDPQIVFAMLPEIKELLLTHLSIQNKIFKENQIEFIKYINNDLKTEDQMVEWLKKI